jgi:hypothetical protein
MRERCSGGGGGVGRRVMRVVRSEVNLQRDGVRTRCFHGGDYEEQPLDLED